MREDKIRAIFFAKRFFGSLSKFRCDFDHFLMVSLENFRVKVVKKVKIVEINKLLKFFNEEFSYFILKNNNGAQAQCELSFNAVNSATFMIAARTVTASTYLLLTGEGCVFCYLL